MQQYMNTPAIENYKRTLKADENEYKYILDDLEHIRTTGRVNELQFEQEAEHSGVSLYYKMKIVIINLAKAFIWAGLTILSIYYIF